MRVYNSGNVKLNEVVIDLDETGIAVFGDTQTPLINYFESIKDRLSESVHIGYTEHPREGHYYYLMDYDMISNEEASKMIINNIK